MLEAGDASTLATWITRYGLAVYGIIIAYALIKPGMMPFFAGIVAQTGALDPLLAGLFFFVGTWIGDIGKFALGRRYGLRLLALWPAAQARALPLSKVIVRHHVAILFLHRCMIGIRPLVPLAAGMSALAWRRFLIVDFFSSLCWTVGLLGAGYSAGAALNALLGEEFESAIIFVALVSIALPAFAAWRINRRKTHLSS